MQFIMANHRTLCYLSYLIGFAIKLDLTPSFRDPKFPFFWLIGARLDI